MATSDQLHLRRPYHLEVVRAGSAGREVPHRVGDELSDSVGSRDDLPGLRAAS